MSFLALVVRRTWRKMIQDITSRYLSWYKLDISSWDWWIRNILGYAWLEVKMIHHGFVGDILPFWKGFKSVWVTTIRHMEIVYSMFGQVCLCNVLFIIDISFEKLLSYLKSCMLHKVPIPSNLITRQLTIWSWDFYLVV